ncbi:MAG: ATP-binding protein [Candidatus Krumholzibacteriia bacterium]
MFVLLAGALVILKVASRSGEKPLFDPRPFPFQLEDVIVAPITPKLPFFVADVDLDGNDDLLINEPTRLLWYRLRGKEMVLEGEAAYERPGSTRMVTDANGDARPEFFVCMWAAEGSMLSCHDWFSPKGPSAPLYTIGPFFPPSEFGTNSWSNTKYFGSLTAEKGAHPTIFIGVNTRKREGRPRTLIAYDGVTGQRLWHFEFGPHSDKLACGDFGVNDPRVLLTTIAVANGFSYNGTADSLSYLFCLDPRDGNLLWEKDVAGFAGRSSLALADINGDGQNEILVARDLASSDPLLIGGIPPWSVAALSREGEVLYSVPLWKDVASICAVDLDSDSSPEILVQGNEGRLVILNHDLTIRKVIKGFRSPSGIGSMILGARDLTDDGKLEILCRADNVFVVRDKEGTLIAGRMLRYLFDVQFARYDGRNYIVAASGDSIRVMTLERTPLATRLRAHASRLTIAELAVAMFLAGVGGFHLRRYLKRRRVGHITFDGAQSDLLTAMSAFGHGGSSLKIIDRIRLHLKNWDRVQSDAAAREELFARLHATFVGTVVTELNQIVMLAHKARVPEGIWGAIVPCAGVAGQEMEAILAAGSGGSGAGRDEHVAGALAALGDVDDSIAGIRSYLRSVFRAPVADALERAVARFRNENGDKRISLVFPPDAPVEEGVFIAPVAFDKIFEALLSNSARATEGRTDAAIAIEVQWEGDYCKIDVRDNGCGIPREDWERAFERSYTTKDVGGFGLYYARETLARFGGKIFVLDSVAGSAATVRVVLRKS